MIVQSTLATPLPSPYILSFDVEATGEHHDLLSVSFVVVDGRSYNVVDSIGFVVIPNEKNENEAILVADDYNWGERCWREFGRIHEEILNATMNNPWFIRVSFDKAPRVIRKRFDDLCQKYEPRVSVDNAAFDCYHLNRTFARDGLPTIEYQMNAAGHLSYEGVIDTTSILSYIASSQGKEVANVIRKSVTVPNDHNPLNDATRHALITAHLYFPRV